MTESAPWILTSGNGCVPDLSNISDSPLKASGTTTGREASKLLDANATARFNQLPQVQIFEHINFGGWRETTSLNWYYVGDWWNDRISSIIVISGTWRFYQHWHYEGLFWDLGPGYYPWIVDNGIPNDMISSFQVISW